MSFRQASSGPFWRTRSGRRCRSILGRLQCVRKLGYFTRLSEDDKTALMALGLGRLRHFSPRETIIAEGDRPQVINHFLDGWA